MNADKLFFDLPAESGALAALRQKQAIHLLSGLRTKIHEVRKSSDVSHNILSPREECKVKVLVSSILNLPQLLTDMIKLIIPPTIFTRL